MRNRARAFALLIAMVCSIAPVGAAVNPVPHLSHAADAADPFLEGPRSGDRDAKLTADDGETDDQFGYGVSLSGLEALVGAPGDDDAGTDEGAAYLFSSTGGPWTQDTKLVNPEPTLYSEFGKAVSLDVDTCSIAAEGSAATSYVDAVYVFTRSGSIWSQQTKLTPSDGLPIAGYGSSLDLDGDWLIASRQVDDPLVVDGKVFLYARSGGVWTEDDTIQLGVLEDRFGSDVAIDGDTALIGASGEGMDQGAAYVFVRSGGVWTQQARLVPTTVVDGLFGNSVALDGDTALIGAPGGTGSANVFVRSGSVWTEQQVLDEPWGDFALGLGADVALDGDRALVFAPSYQDLPLIDQIGFGLIFERSGSTWSYVDYVSATDGFSTDAYAEWHGMVDLDGDVALAGAYAGNGLETGAGAAYIHELAATTPSPTGSATATRTPTLTPTQTPFVTQTPTRTPTRTPTMTPTQTAPTNTPEPLPVPTTGPTGLALLALTLGGLFATSRRKRRR